MLLNIARTAEARCELEAALALHEVLADEAGTARTREMLAVTMWVVGDVDQTMRHAQAAAESLRIIGDRQALALALCWLGSVRAYVDGFAGAEAFFDEALRLARAIEAKSVEAFIWGLIADIAGYFCLYERALRDGTAALDIARGIGHREWTAMTLSKLGRVRAACGDLPGARRHQEEMLGIAGELGTVLWLIEARANLAQLCLLEGDLDGATALLTQAIEIGGDAALFVVHAVRLEGEVALLRGQADAALAAVHRFDHMGSGFRVHALDVRRIEAEALVLGGDTPRAEALLRQVTHDAAAMGARPAGWRAAVALGELLARPGELEDARREASTARELLERAAAELTDPGLRAGLLDSEPMRRARALGG
jgi:tetratricopeptide (TPR) repeat protein